MIEYRSVGEEKKMASSQRSPAEIQDERNLILACQEGRESAFQKLFEKHQRRAYAVAYNIVSDFELAKDIVQEAFIRVYKNIRKFDATKNFYTWLYQIVVNLSIDYLRKRASSKAAPLDELGDGVKTKVKLGGPSDSASRDELKKRVREMLDLMPGKYKVVLALRDIEGFSCEEIAEVVHCKNSTVRWRIHQARKLFKSLWNGDGVNLKDYYEGNDDDM
jgi:RNA polymerase sigma-70 factor (ECF subfamily)